MEKHTEVDEFLIHLATGSEQGILKIYSNCYPSIEKYILSNNGTVQDAKDVFQDGLIVFYENQKSPDFQLLVKFETYLFAICKNIWLKQLRLKKRSNAVTFDDDLVLIDEDFIELELSRHYRYKLYKSKFNLLGNECKKLLTLFFQKKSMVEITRLLNYKNDSYTRKKKYKCKEKLTQLIKKDPDFNRLKQ